MKYASRHIRLSYSYTSDQMATTCQTIVNLRRYTKLHSYSVKSCVWCMNTIVIQSKIQRTVEQMTRQELNCVSGRRMMTNTLISIHFNDFRRYGGTWNRKKGPRSEFISKTHVKIVTTHNRIEMNRRNFRRKELQTHVYVCRLTF